MRSLVSNRVVGRLVVPARSFFSRRPLGLLKLVRQERLNKKYLKEEFDKQEVFMQQVVAQLSKYNTSQEKIDDLADEVRTELSYNKDSLRFQVSKLIEINNHQYIPVSIKGALKKILGIDLPGDIQSLKPEVKKALAAYGTKNESLFYALSTIAEDQSIAEQDRKKLKELYPRETGNDQKEKEKKAAKKTFINIAQWIMGSVGALLTGYLIKDPISIKMNEISHIGKTKLFMGERQDVSPENLENFCTVERSATAKIEKEISEKKISDSSADVKAVQIIGQAGAGKSEVALQLAQKYHLRMQAKKKQFPYQYIETCVIFNAENKAILEAQYRKFAQCLKIKDAKDMKLEDLKRSVDKELAFRKDWMLIFDNVPENAPSYCKGFMPSKVKHFDFAPVKGRNTLAARQKGTVIYTCRKEIEQEGSDVFNLSDERLQMLPKEAIELFEMAGGDKVTRYYSSAAKLDLIKQLRFSPVAIKRAGAYLGRIGERPITMSSYLNSLQGEMEKNAKNQAPSVDAVFTVANARLSSSAKLLLKHLVLIDPDCLEASVLQELLLYIEETDNKGIFGNVLKQSLLPIKGTDNKENFENVVKQLSEFSLLEDLHNGTYRVHRSTRDFMDKQNDLQSLRKVVKFFGEGKHFSRDNVTSYSRAIRNKKYIHHAEVILDKAHARGKGFIEENLTEIVYIYAALGNFHNFYGPRNKAAEMLNQGKELAEEVLAGTGEELSTEARIEAYITNKSNANKALASVYSSVLYMLGKNQLNLEELKEDDKPWKLLTDAVTIRKLIDRLCEESPSQKKVYDPKCYNTHNINSMIVRRNGTVLHQLLRADNTSIVAAIKALEEMRNEKEYQDDSFHLATCHKLSARAHLIASTNKITVPKNQTEDALKFHLNHVLQQAKFLKEEGENKKNGITKTINKKKDIEILQDQEFLDASKKILAQTKYAFMAESLVLYGLGSLEKGSINIAEHCFNAVIDYYEKTNVSPHRALAEAKYGLSRVCLENNDLTDAGEAAKESVVIYENLSGIKAENAKGDKELQRALALRKSLLGEEPYRTQRQKRISFVKEFSKAGPEVGSDGSGYEKGV